MKLHKSATFSDIHFGARNNSEQHNQDCLQFIKWFCSLVRGDSKIDHISFLGDWYENRSSINVETMNFSYQGAKLLNDLGMPVYFLVGNHDLYRRNTREIYSTFKFQDLSNFVIIDKPTIIDDIGNGAFLCPFMFHEEYPKLKQYKKKETWWGHFEFKGFVITGETIVLEHGPDHTEFNGPKHIFSGHFHKRQASDNIVYVGNPFGTKFSDANDFERGTMVYNHNTDDIFFYNWEDGPKYVSTTLSSLMETKNISFPKNSRVKCLLDIDIDFETQIELKKSMQKEFELREFKFDEIPATISESDDPAFEFDDDIESVNDMVIAMLDTVDTGKSKSIKPEKLKELYVSLKVDDNE